MNDWALILGASSGIGAACAKALAEKGINIYGLYLRRKQSHIDELINDLSQYGVKVIYKKANVACASLMFFGFPSILFFNITIVSAPRINPL